jgi:N-acetyl-gamma-glutamyl-phosphate reductase
VVSVNTAATPDEVLLRRSMAPSDRLELSVFGARDGSQARLMAVLDNLGKGASGAAVQSLNLMAGLPEDAGLAL